MSAVDSAPPIPKGGAWGALRKRILPSLSSFKRRLSNPFVRKGSMENTGGSGKKGKGRSLFGRGKGNNQTGYCGNPQVLDCPMHRCVANGGRGCLCPENNVRREPSTCKMAEAVHLMLFQRTASDAGESDIE